MSVQSEITRITGNIASAYTAVSGKGGTLPAAKNSANLPAAISSIPGGKPEQSKTLTLGAAAPSTVTPDSGKVLSSVPVVLDTSVIKAANIAKGVTMLGITGAHEGGGGGGETCSLTVSGQYGMNLVYIDVNGNPVIRNSVNNETIIMRKVPFSGKGLNEQGIPIMSGVIAYQYNSAGQLEQCPSYVSGKERLYVPTSDTMSVVISCFLPDTRITLADGTKKQIKDLTYSDSLKVWNFDTGELDTAPICWLTRSGLYSDHYYKLTFSDGTILKTTGQNSNHKVYNVDERFFKGVDKTEIGDRIFSENGIVTVTNKEYIEEEIEYYNLITTGTINCFAEGILTSDRYGNLYPIDENMMYVKDGRYRPYEEFEAVGIKRYWYDTLRLAEVSGTIEETRAYIDKLECQMLPLPEEPQ